MAAMNQQFAETCGREVPDSVQGEDEVVGARPAWANTAARLSSLVRTIEGEVIPRLVLAHRSGALPPLTFGFRPMLLDANAVAELADLAIKHDATFLTTHVQQLRARGLATESLYLNLLAPTARRLGEMWDDDLCDFATVTMALWRLQQVVRNLSSSFVGEADAAGESQRVILASMPGEQHTFGLFMVAEFFRRAGWDVVDAPRRTRDELVGVIRSEPFAVAGLSLARESGLDELTGLIGAIRSASRNRSIKIMVGGPVFIERPELVRRVGGDATASDGRTAVDMAQDMLSIPPRSC